MVAISVDLTVEGWTLDRILAERMQTRSSYASAMVGVLRAAGYELVPTGRAPHYSLILPGAPTPRRLRFLPYSGLRFRIPTERGGDDHERHPDRDRHPVRRPGRGRARYALCAAERGARPEPHRARRHRHHRRRGGSGLRPSPLADAAGRPHGGPPRAAAW